MKGTGKFLIIIGMIAALFLLYVHFQVLIFQVSYAIEIKAKVLTRCHESYRRLKFQVEQLKAPQNLAEKMTTYKLDLQVPKEIHVLQAPALPPVELVPMGKTTFQPFSKGLIDFLGHWVKVAQADTNS
ncbi:MAG: hypothetical protein PHS88_10735 [Candidatus Omnitrophica bacterium]|nr:hypothetical protein [Candidatus Omnitrophota bacterium]